MAIQAFTPASTITAMTFEKQTQHHALNQVIAASQAWIEAFNRQDVDACIAGYTDKAIMHAQPMGRFEGREAISGFWRPFIEKGATDLKYWDVAVRALQEGQVELSASWSMNVGGGVITKELWVQTTDGTWLLAEDHFEVQTQAEG